MSKELCESLAFSKLYRKRASELFRVFFTQDANGTWHVGHGGMEELAEKERAWASYQLQHYDDGGCDQYHPGANWMRQVQYFNGCMKARAFNVEAYLDQLTVYEPIHARRHERDHLKRKMNLS
ncbi:unnamed protein product [Fusarium langsethiae]|nr:unnamed protein product [Fusarium langsethiae]